MELFLDLLRSVVYGVIEGITEWLPISSTGHMILAEQVLKFSLSAEFMEMFRVVIQLGAIMAVVVLYFKKLWPFCGDNGRDSGLAKHIRWPVLRLWLKIIVACLPAAVLGLLLDDWMDAHFYNSVVVAVMLIVYGIAFILIERRPRVPTTTKLSRITYKQAIIVGVWQVLALIPGTSRSGATIIGGLLCGSSPSSWQSRSWRVRRASSSSSSWWAAACSPLPRSVPCWWAASWRLSCPSWQSAS